jgi:hypothetical protein
LEQFKPALLDQGRELEPAADLVDHVVFAKGRRRIAYWSARRGGGTLTVAVSPLRTGRARD